jgi:hypothetical protein
MEFPSPWVRLMVKVVVRDNPLNVAPFQYNGRLGLELPTNITHVITSFGNNSKLEGTSFWTWPTLELFELITLQT